MTPARIASRLIGAVEDDNDSRLRVTEPQRAALNEGVTRMLAAGFPFTASQIEDIAAGEYEEVNERYRWFDGWEETNAALEWIFNGDDDP